MKHQIMYMAYMKLTWIFLKGALLIASNEVMRKDGDI